MNRFFYDLTFTLAIGKDEFYIETPFGIHITNPIGNSFLGNIRGWNNSRSLKNAIKTFADFFEIPYLSEETVDIRDKIAHNGVVGNNRKDYSS